MFRAVQLSRRHSEQAVGRRIGAQNDAVGGHGQDRGRAAVDQKLQLLLGLAARGRFRLHPAQILRLPAAAARHLVGEQAGAGQRREHQDVLRQRRAEGETERVEHIGQQCAEQRGQNHLPAGQDRAHQQHGKQVEEAEGEVEVDPPVDQRDHRDQNDGPDENARVLPCRSRNSNPCIP